MSSADGNYSPRFNSDSIIRKSNEAHDQSVEILPGAQVSDLNAQRIFKFITEENAKGLIQYLKMLPNRLDLTIMKDALNFSLLTYCAYLNDANAFKIIFEYAWKKSVNERHMTKEQA